MIKTCDNPRCNKTFWVDDYGGEQYCTSKCQKIHEKIKEKKGRYNPMASVSILKTSRDMMKDMKIRCSKKVHVDVNYSTMVEAYVRFVKERDPSLKRFTEIIREIDGLPMNE